MDSIYKPTTLQKTILGIFLISSILMVSCRPYKASWSKASDGRPDIDENTMIKFNSEKDIPLRLKKGMLFYNMDLTFDSTDFANSKNKTLVLDGGFNRQEKRGYLLFKDRSNRDSSIYVYCVTFSVVKKVLNHTTYLDIPISVHNIKEAKPYLTTDHTRIVGGLTYKDSKEYRKLKRLHVKIPKRK